MTSWRHTQLVLLAMSIHVYDSLLLHEAWQMVCAGSLLLPAWWVG
jgi:hypothetical protein